LDTNKELKQANQLQSVRTSKYYIVLLFILAFAVLTLVLAYMGYL